MENYLIYKLFHGLSYYYIYMILRNASPVPGIMDPFKLLFILSETEIALHKLFLRSVFFFSLFEADYHGQTYDPCYSYN